MVGNLIFKITGADKLEAKLRGLGPQVAGKIGDDSLTAGSNYIARQIRARAPVKTGRLKKSIRSQKVRTFGNLKARTIGFVRPGRFYSHLVEFGTSKAPAHPFIRPALDASASRAILEIGARLWRGIEAYSIGRILTTLDEDKG